MNLLLQLVKREISLALRQKSELLQPLMFFILVIMLFPLGVSPSPVTLQLIGPGVIWVAAILSLLLGIERMFRDDFIDGSLEQFMLSPIPLPLFSLVKVLTHWLIHIGPLLLVSPLLALFLNLTVEMYWALIATLLVGTPIISLIGGIGVALTLGIHKGGVLLSLLLIPVFIPLLIFSTAAIESASMLLPYSAQIAMIGALFFITLALAPFAIAYSLKVTQN